jgi:hypothetical protein
MTEKRRATSTAPPLITFATDGTAPVISANIPEPGAFANRNYIDLQVPKEHFKPTNVLTQLSQINSASGEVNQGALNSGSGSAQIAAPGIPSTTPGYNVIMPSGVYSIREDSNKPWADGNWDVASHNGNWPDGMSNSSTARPRALDAETFVAAAQTGRSVQVYRSMSGSLSYRIRSSPDSLDEPILPAVGEPEDPAPPFHYVTLNLPPHNAALTGPSTGINVTAKGAASRLPDVTIGGTSATNVDYDVEGQGWTASVDVTTEGPCLITASVSGPGLPTRTSEITVHVSFNDVRPSDDKTPPDLTVTSPQANEVIVGRGTVSKGVTGTASDGGSGVDGVALKVDTTGTFAPATPVAPGDFSTWSATVDLNQGSHTIIVRCTDKKNNIQDIQVPVLVTSTPPVQGQRNHLLLIEEYRLSSFLGAYGAGRVVKTFSLLPGEKTKISVRTYTRQSTSRKEASSILDSFGTESGDDFEKSILEEQTSKENYESSFEYRVSAEASASWGWGSAKISAGISGGTNAAREDFAKNLVNATQKHTARASQKRDVQINTEYEVKTETGVEESIERELQNINVSRTLNFVFRQMNQEFITILHLVDVRIGYASYQDGKLFSYREVTLPALDSLLDEVIVATEKSNYKAAIETQLRNIFDHEGKLVSLVEQADLKDAEGNSLGTYLRVTPKQVSKFTDPVTGTEVVVPGIIIAGDKIILRTEGVIAEALLGQGEALDDYSIGLQDATVLARQLDNQRVESETKKSELAQSIIEQKDETAAKVYEKVYPCCPEQEALIKVETEKPKQS